MAFAHQEQHMEYSGMTLAINYITDAYENRSCVLLRDKSALWEGVLFVDVTMQFCLSLESIKYVFFQKNRKKKGSPGYSVIAVLNSGTQRSMDQLGTIQPNIALGQLGI